MTSWLGSGVHEFVVAWLAAAAAHSIRELTNTHCWPLFDISSWAKPNRMERKLTSGANISSHVTHATRSSFPERAKIRVVY